MGIIIATSLTMKPKRKILLSLIATAIIGYGIVKENQESSIPHPTSSIQHTIELNKTYFLPHHLSLPQGTSGLDRDKILKKSLKGYREQTFWGNEHPIDQTIKDFNDKEFSDFVEDEVKSSDKDIYWGTEY